MKTVSALLQNYLNGNKFALSLSGTNQYVNCGNNAVLSPIVMSIEAVVETGIMSTTQPNYIFATGRDTPPPNGGICFNVPNPGTFLQFIAILPDGTSRVLNSLGNVIANNTRYHLACTYDGQIANLYINGILARTSDFGSVKYLGPMPASYNATIGNLQLIASNLYNWPGKILDVKYYGRVVSATEMTEHAAGVFKNNSGLALWIPFNDGAGLTATDFSGYGNNGTLVNSPTWVASEKDTADARQFRVCDLLTITPTQAPAVYYTNGDIDITVGGNLFLSGDVKFKRSKVELKTGLDVSTLELELYGDSTNLIGGTPLLSACRAGILDGARVKLERLYMPSFANTVLGTVNMFTGRMGQMNFSRSVAKIKVVSDTILLNINMPRNVYQPGCRHTLFDSGCTLDKAAFLVAGVVAAGSTTTSVNSNLTNADDYFTLGSMTMTSGANNGLTRTVKRYKNTGGVIAPILPWPVAPANGDTFNAYPGDDKQQSTCQNKFNNIVHFRAEPYIPIPETQL